MKKYLLIALALFVVSSVSLVSEEIRIGEKEPCTYWWPNLEWDGPHVTSITKGDCVYICTFWRRTNDVGREEVQVTEWYEITGNIGCAINWDIRNEFYVHIWQHYPEYFPADESEYIAQSFPCDEVNYYQPDDNIDIVISPGLLDLGLIPPEINYEVRLNGDVVFTNIGSSVLPCTDNVCCSMFYHITRVEGKIVAVEWYDLGMPPQEKCDNPNQCQPACNSLKFNWYADGYGVQFPSNIAENNKSYETIYPNPSNGEFTLDYSSDIIGQGSVNIYDINGNLVYYVDINKRSNYFVRRLFTKKLSKATYILLVRINGKIDYFGKLIIK